MRRRALFLLAASSLLAGGCQDTAAPSPSLTGVYVADSIYWFNHFDTGGEILPLGASLTFTLLSDSSMTGHLSIPVAWAPPGLPALNDDLAGTWSATAEGFRLHVASFQLLTGREFTVRGDTASATVNVISLPLDPFGYRFRLHRM